MERKEFIKMSKDYTELLKAVDLIVSQRLNNVAFDKTLVCKIVNDKNKSNAYARQSKNRL